MEMRAAAAESPQFIKALQSRRLERRFAFSDHRNQTENTANSLTCCLREILLDVVQHSFAVPVDLFMVLSEGLLRVQRPGHHILLSCRAHRLAFAASSLCGSEVH